MLQNQDLILICSCLPPLSPSPSSRLKEFKSSLLEVFRTAHAQSVGMQSLMSSMNKDRQAPFTPDEVRAALARMQDDNQVMVANDIIFLI